jgi:hypothetical protein
VETLQARQKIMAEHGEWNAKGATLSDVSAQKEYNVSKEFILAGINAGKLEFREGAIWGNPYYRILRRQLEDYIAESLGEEYVSSVKNKAELKKVKREINSLKKKLHDLLKRKDELEKSSK